MNWVTFSSPTPNTIAQGPPLSFPLRSTGFPCSLPMQCSRTNEQPKQPLLPPSLPPSLPPFPSSRCKQASLRWFAPSLRCSFVVWSFPRGIRARARAQDSSKQSERARRTPQQSRTPSLPPSRPHEARRRSRRLVGWFVGGFGGIFRQVNVYILVVG